MNKVTTKGTPRQRLDRMAALKNLFHSLVEAAPLRAKGKARPPARRQPPSKTAKEAPNPIDQIQRIIESSGYKLISVAALFKAFGFRKRSSANISAVLRTLRSTGLYVYPPIHMETNWKEVVRIYGFPVEQLGDLFESESELENYVHNHKLFRSFGVDSVQIQYSPKRSRDRLDMLGTDPSGGRVVLEFKNKDGGKTSVEQVLRYLGILRREKPGTNVRGVLITGVRGLDTALAIHGMAPEQKKEFKWYLYKYEKKAGKLTFSEVKMDYIDRLLRK